MSAACEGKQTVDVIGAEILYALVGDPVAQAQVDAGRVFLNRVISARSSRKTHCRASFVICTWVPVKCSHGRIVRESHSRQSGITVKVTGHCASTVPAKKLFFCGAGHAGNQSHIVQYWQTFPITSRHFLGLWKPERQANHMKSLVARIARNYPASGTIRIRAARHVTFFRNERFLAGGLGPRPPSRLPAPEQTALHIPGRSS